MIFKFLPVETKTFDILPKLCYNKSVCGFAPRKGNCLLGKAVHYEQQNG